MFKSAATVDKTTSWPQILGYLRQWFAARHIGLPKPALNTPLVCCAICSTELAIESLQPVRFAPEEEGLDDQEEGIFTQCGHVLGMSCMEIWVECIDRVDLGGIIPRPSAALISAEDHNTAASDTRPGLEVLSWGWETIHKSLASYPTPSSLIPRKPCRKFGTLPTAPWLPRQPKMMITVPSSRQLRLLGAVMVHSVRTK